MTEATHAAPAANLAPMLSVRRGAQAVEFYKKAFDAQELFRIEDDAGAVVAQLAVHGAKYGWHVGRLVDPFGHHWEIGRPLSAGVGE